jgi:hypothetical protein
LLVQPSIRPNAVWCVSYQLLSRSWHSGIEYGLFHLSDLKIRLGSRRMWFEAGVTRTQGIFTPPGHLISPLIYAEVCVCPILWFAFPTQLVRSDGSLCMSFHKRFKIDDVELQCQNNLLFVTLWRVEHHGESATCD